jgi:hypothetical protein
MINTGPKGSAQLGPRDRFLTESEQSHQPLRAVWQNDVLVLDDATESVEQPNIGTMTARSGRVNWL